ncbi:MAG: DUF1846 domain-containing protein [Mycoplasmoidaceae bacterium]|nr:DUF1846 domain-containing protein [Mycoplasmoidaceae bacterium]
MKKLGIDTKKYLKIQKKAILDRIKKFDSKLYLEFGGKLIDDFHASRVLPGFEADAKLQLLLQFKKDAEVIIVVNAQDLNNNKVRGDSNLSYEAEVQRLIGVYSTINIPICGVVISLYEESQHVKEFTRLLRNLGVKVYKHYKIAGYPKDIPLILSKEGLGKNEYVETHKKLVIVTAPGPGSGKMATCLSQLYHAHLKGKRAGYAKYETFPIWNLPLKHPVNIAYEAATLELNDGNMIDPFHLQHYKKTATNYNRDIASFPLLKAIFEQLYGRSPYHSPTDMGVNMLGFAITNDRVCVDAAKKEIVRRYYSALKDVFLGKYDNSIVTKAELLMHDVNVKAEDRICVKACLEKQKSSKNHAVAIEIKKGVIVCGRQSDDLTASAAATLNALKTLGKIQNKIYLMSPYVLDPIRKMKSLSFGSNGKLNLSETLVALAIQSLTTPLAAIALKQLPLLKGAQAHASCILNQAELNIFKKLGINITEQAASYISTLKIDTTKEKEA